MYLKTRNLFKKPIMFKNSEIANGFQTPKSLLNIAVELQHFHNFICQTKPIREEMYHLHVAALIKGRKIINKGYNHRGVLQGCV